MTNTQRFEAYMTQEIDAVYRFAWTFTRNREEAEDVVGESVVRALRSLDSLREPDRIGAWFYRIVANTARTAMRKRGRETPTDPSDLTELPDAGEDATAVGFEQLIGMLDEPHRTVIVLRFLEDRPLQEIADILGENLNTVKSRMYRALRMLRVEVGDFV